MVHQEEDDTMTGEVEEGVAMVIGIDITTEEVVADMNEVVVVVVMTTEIVTDIVIEGRHLLIIAGENLQAPMAVIEIVSSIL